MKRIVKAQLLFCSLAAVTVVRSQDMKPFNAILIGWDGAQRNHIQECLQRGELPRLKELIDEGRFVEIDIEGTTDTKAGWTQILTGYNPDKTGVYSNQKYGAIPEGYTVFERLENFFGVDKITTVAVIGKKGNIGVEPERKIALTRLKEPRRKKLLAQSGVRSVTENDRKYLVVPAQPFAKSKNALDVFLNGITFNEAVGAKTLELLERNKDRRFFFFVHFAESDHEGHLFGENSKEYNNALISADTWLGKIMEKLKQLDIYGTTRIYLTADHGFDEGQKQHHYAPYVFLATNDADVQRNGTRADITPTILVRFGLDLMKIQPKLDGQPLLKSHE